MIKFVRKLQDDLYILSFNHILGVEVIDYNENTRGMGKIRNVDGDDVYKIVTHKINLRGLYFMTDDGCFIDYIGYMKKYYPDYLEVAEAQYEYFRKR